MIDTHLIVFDGIAGSGKTTTAQWLYLALSGAGRESEWITEAQRDHPIFGPEVEVERARTTEEVVERTLDAWRRFVGDAAVAPLVSVMDGGIFDSPISFLLLRDTPPARIGSVVSEIVKAATALRPVFFYFYQDDTDEALEQISRRRGEDWRAHLIAYVSASPFARSRNLSGMDAPRAYYREHRRIADAAFAHLDIGKAAISTSGGRWDAYRARVIESLDLSSDLRPDAAAMDLSRFAGEYRDAEHDRTWRIVSDENSLYLAGDERMRLLHIDGTRFFIEGKPVELRFEGSDRAPAERIQYLSKARDGLKSELTWIRVTGTENPRRPV